MLDRIDLSLDPAIAETARDKYPVDIEKIRCYALFYVFRIDVPDIYPAVVRNAAVDKGFVEALIGILKLDVFSDKRDVDLFFRVLYRVADRFPLGEVRLFCPDVQVLS